MALFESELRFGVDIQRQLEEWWIGEYLPQLRERYGADANVAVVVLDPRAMQEDTLWENPLGEVLYSLLSGVETDELFTGPTGLVANVAGKLRFVLRTRLNSIAAESRHDLVEPGDFPHEGAGTHRDYTGGASGLLKESDWRVLCDVVDKIILLRAAAAQPALDASRDRAPDAGPEVKYMTAEWVVGVSGVPTMQVEPPRPVAASNGGSRECVDYTDHIAPR